VPEQGASSGSAAVFYCNSEEEEGDINSPEGGLLRLSGRIICRNYFSKRLKC